MIAELLEHDYKHAHWYWRKLKQRLAAEGNETVTKCHTLKLLTADGKQRKSDVVNTEQALRLIQSIPSPKAEPMKLWLAQGGMERIQESEDPEQATEKLYSGLWGRKTAQLRGELSLKKSANPRDHFGE